MFEPKIDQLSLALEVYKRLPLDATWADKMTVWEQLEEEERRRQIQAWVASNLRSEHDSDNGPAD